MPLNNFDQDHCWIYSVVAEHEHQALTTIVAGQLRLLQITKPLDYDRSALQGASPRLSHIADINLTEHLSPSWPHS